MQPGIIPTQMPMQQMQMQQMQMMQQGGGQQQEQQLSGYIEDFEILDGEKEDVDRVMDLLRRGKKFTGEKLPDFIERISFPEDCKRFVDFVGDYLEEFEDDHLHKCVAECEHPECKLFIVEQLYPRVEKPLGAIMKSKIANLMHSNDDKDKAKEVMGF